MSAIGLMTRCFWRFVCIRTGWNWTGGTTYLHRYKKTEAYKVSDLQGVTIKKRTVTWRYSALRSLPLKFKKAEDAQEFYNAVNSL